MKACTTFLLFLLTFSIKGQDVVYSESFDNEIFSIVGNPGGYTLSKENEALRIIGNGTANPYAAWSYNFHNGNGTAIIVNAATVPKLYIKAKGSNNPILRIDFQDNTGYVTNLNAVEVALSDEYQILEYNYTGKLLDGAYGGPCTSSPCTVDASRLKSLVFFVNAANGGYDGEVLIDWISIGAPLEVEEVPPYQIRYNQVGYAFGRPKLITLEGAEDFGQKTYEIIDLATETVVKSGTIAEPKYWEYARTYVSTIDFSDIEIIGTYKLVTEDAEEDFVISDFNLNALRRAALKYFYYNRASIEISSNLGGDFARPFGHPDDVVYVHPSAASTGRPAGTVISGTKGWYDAGDYNKYIVNSGISTYTLLAAFEHYPDYYKNLRLEIPETGGELPDILDEILWNLEWMLDMQDPFDGGVYHKLTGKNFSGSVMPHEYTLDRYVVQKTTSAALNFASVTAVAARIFKNYEDQLPGFSDICLNASRKAFIWAKNNPAIYYSQPADISTGAYGDGNVSDEFAWATAELAITTEESQYIDAINESSIGTGVPAWPYTAPLALISLSHHSESLTDHLNMEIINNKLLQSALALKATIETSPFKVAMGTNGGDFVWGSNGTAGNQLMMLIRAYELTKDDAFLDAAFIGIDYLLGRNSTGYCYVTGFGKVSPLFPHHRISHADDVTRPVPGMVAGGPHSGQNDNCSGYPNNFPASSYVDSWCSYATNEVTINWNAPFAYVANALHFYQESELGSGLNFDKPLMEEIKLFPNPTSNFLQLFLNEDYIHKYSVVSSNGLLVLNGVVSNYDNLDVSSLDNGLYFILIKGENNQTKWGKFIKI